MKARKKNNDRYTIGPHGEIYNNQPELSPRARNMMELFALQDALDEAVSKMDEATNTDSENEEDIEDADEGTPEADSEELHN